MWGALLKLITQRPDLLVDHVSSYADIAQAEFRTLRRRWIQRLLASVAALLLAVVALTVAAVAVMLIVADVTVVSWRLFAPALVIGALSAICAWIAQRAGTPSDRSSALDSLRKDLSILSELGASR